MTSHRCCHVLLAFAFSVSSGCSSDLPEPPYSATCAAGTNAASSGAAGSAARTREPAQSSPSTSSTRPRASGSQGNASTAAPAPEPAVCEDAAPCGGDLTGRWLITNVCYFVPDPFLEGCPQASASFVLDEIGGEMSFDGAYSYTFSVLGHGSFLSEVPLSCLGGDSDCSALEKNDTTCELIRGVCSCSRPLKVGAEGVQEGEYEVTGTNLDLLDDIDGDYCVNGTQMSWGDAVMMPMMGVEAEVQVQFKLESTGASNCETSCSWGEACDIEGASFSSHEDCLDKCTTGWPKRSFECREAYEEVFACMRAVDSDCDRVTTECGPLIDATAGPCG